MQVPGPPSHLPQLECVLTQALGSGRQHIDRAVCGFAQPVYVQQPQQAKQNRGCLEAWCACFRPPALLSLASVCCGVCTDTCCALFLCAAWRAVRGPANMSQLVK